MRNLQKINIVWIAWILAIVPLGMQNFEKLAQSAQISRSSGQGSVNWADFVQFTVNFETSIYHGAKRKMVCEFCIICMNGGLFSYLGGVHGFLTICMCVNGADFTSFII